MNWLPGHQLLKPSGPYVTIECSNLPVTAQCKALERFRFDITETWTVWLIEVISMCVCSAIAICPVKFNM